MLSSATLAMITAGHSDVGRVRSRNEDSYGLAPELGLALVCDGMGGHAGGDIASRTVVQAVTGAVDEAPAAARGNARSTAVLVHAALRRANQRLVDLNRERGFAQGRGMGTTVVGVCRVAGGNQVVAFHAGDSRLYRWRAGGLHQLTRDHSLYQLWLDSGEKGPAPQRNVLVRALGTVAEPDPEIALHPVEAGDTLLLCSDGLTAMVPDPAIAALLGREERHGLDTACERLVALANERGGHDNITVVLARFEPPGR